MGVVTVSALPPVFIEFLGKSTGVKTAIRGVETELATVDAEGAGSFAKTGMLGKAAILGLGVAAAETAKKTVEMAGDFQQQMTRVRTGAGEAASNMKLVSNGVLAMAGQVGQSTTELTAGLYTVESASYHGSAALEVLKDSAEGAKVGNADLHVTADAVTTALNAYKMGADHAAQATNALIATESEGKTNLEDLAGSMAKVLPTAAAAHVGLDEVLGAMATMTAQGTPAAVAATYLRQTIGNLSNPTAHAADEMKNLGLNAVEVSQTLGRKGLAATLTMLTTAIEQHMGPAGTVVIQHLRGASKSATQFQKVLANLPPAQQTYIGALATMVGGTKSMMAALQLTGPHMADFQKNTAGISEHVKAGGKNIEGWTEVQGNFNQKVDQAKASLQAMGIQIGQVLMPYVQHLVSALATGATWLTQHAAAAKVAAGVIGGVLVFALAAVTAQLYAMAAAAAVDPVTWIVLGVVALIAAIVLLVMHWKQVWGAIKATTMVVVGALITAWDTVRDATVTAWDAVVGAVVGAWDATVDAVVGAWDAVRDATVGAWDTVLGALEDAWDAIAGFFVDAWHTVVDPIVGAWQFVESMTVTWWNRVTAFFKKWWPLLFLIAAPFIAAMVAAWNHFHTQILAIVHTVWGAVTWFLSTVWRGVQVIAGLVWTAIRVTIITPMMATWHALQALWTTVSGWLSTAWNGIKKVAGQVWGQVRDALAAVWTAIRSKATSVWTAISSTLASVWRSIRRTATSIWNTIKTAMTGPITTAWHTITTTVDHIKTAIQTGLDNAWTAVTGIGSKFESIGKAIIDGIKQGVENAAGDLAKAVKNAANSALSGAKHFLGISSPSRVFAEQVGKWIPAGIAQGVTDHAHLARTAVSTLSAGLPTAMSVGGGASIALGLGAGGGATVIHQHLHVTVQGHVMTDRQLIDVVQQGFGQLGSQNSMTWQPYKR